jgi:hypothetical protein
MNTWSGTSSSEYDLYRLMMTKVVVVCIKGTWLCDFFYEGGSDCTDDCCVDDCCADDCCVDVSRAKGGCCDITSSTSLSSPSSSSLSSSIYSPLLSLSEILNCSLFNILR